MRVGVITLVCIVVSFAASGLMMAGVVLEYGGELGIDGVSRELLTSPACVAAQAFIDAVLMVLLCSVADVLVRRVAAQGNDRTLLSMFRNWMLLIAAIVFMLTSAIVFSVTTNRAQESDNANMLTEVASLATQAGALGVSDYGVLLESYDAKVDGYVIITDEKASVLASNSDERFPVGESLIDLITSGDEPIYKETDEGLVELSEQEFMDMIARENRATSIQAMNEDGVMTMDCALIAASPYDGGYAAMVRTSDMVYADRLGIMAAITLLAIALIAAIAVLATVLLNRVVVRRIGETNESLGKITHGNLNERVRVQDSREFLSLSEGINTTVSALKETIQEVEQRNAQDLATAKAIQESALPREFPPFPDIDCFDIYASMKTAKEVGGDFYDFFLIEDGADETGKLGFVMADVSGKGIPAALFMMTAKTQIRNYLETGMPVNEAADAAPRPPEESGRLSHAGRGSSCRMRW
ncbi:MAG: SpoIIE family protein phosphatase [Eggerthellaceae bacterium]|nr:SpoIIE family protein phosphatase [Eggerthellaceae bacterium]MBQ9044164.1 SpoIIE family protein phosphatase [Eggerthellaceae bacterium]